MIKKECKVAGCQGEFYGRELCRKHYQKWRKYGDPCVTKVLVNGEYRPNGHGYIEKTVDGKRKCEHVTIAESAIGKELPIGSQVHHINGIRHDNRNQNLVVCQDVAYHRLLHIRTDALNITGDATKRKCCYCKKYDDIDNLSKRKQGWFYHRSCNAKHEKMRRANLGQARS